ncbi:FeoA family protein [Halochromatium glycolicum]|nr:FeoA family protein [Halochromatium glycolicum]
MQTSLDQAPVGQALRLGPVLNGLLAERLHRLGLYPGCVLYRQDEEIQLQPVRVRGPRGEATLTSGMAAKVIVHHDDDHKTPIIEMRPGEQGHIEGLTAGTGLEEALRTLGFVENDRITLLRKIPPMRYKAQLDGGRRLSFTESVAAKLWGELDGRPMQFANARKDHPFRVIAILGGEAAQAQIASLGIREGDRLSLQTVCPDEVVGEPIPAPIVITSADGLRLYLRPDQAQLILVETRAAASA